MHKFSKSDRSILIANLLDHFDGALYGFLAPIMAVSFFPKHDPIIQIILAYSFFATSIVTRPIGSVIFGLMARKYGPAKPLFYSLIGVGICSVLVGLIPGYKSIGYLSAFLLLLLRCIKGIFSAGESVIAKLYILEGKDSKKSYRASYMYHGSSMIGIIMASLASTYVYLMDVPDFWRICYILGGAVGLYAYSLRKDHTKLTDIEDNNYEFEKLSSNLIWKYRFPILAVIFTTGLSHITYLVPCVIMNSLIPFVTEIDIDEMMKVNNLLLFFDMSLIFILGPIVARYNYSRVKVISSAIMFITIPMMFIYTEGANIIYISFIRFWIVFLGVIFMIPQNIFYKEIFKSLKSKYLIIGLANSIGAAFIGKLTPVIMFYLYYRFENIIIPGFYISIIALFSGYFVWRSREVVI